MQGQELFGREQYSELAMLRGFVYLFYLKKINPEQLSVTLNWEETRDRKEEVCISHLEDI